MPLQMKKQISLFLNMIMRCSYFINNKKLRYSTVSTTFNCNWHWKVLCSGRSCLSSSGPCGSSITWFTVRSTFYRPSRWRCGCAMRTACAFWSTTVISKGTFNCNRPKYGACTIFIIGGFRFCYCFCSCKRWDNYIYRVIHHL